MPVGKVQHEKMMQDAVWIFCSEDVHSGFIFKTKNDPVIVTDMFGSLQGRRDLQCAVQYALLIDVAVFCEQQISSWSI